MQAEGTLYESELDAILADGRFRRTHVHLLGWWRSLLTGLNLEKVRGRTSLNGLRWTIVDAPLFDADDPKIGGVSDADDHIGTVEWAHVVAGVAEVIIVILSYGKDREDVWLYANHPTAPSFVRDAAMRVGVAWKARRERRALAPPSRVALPRPAPRFTPTERGCMLSHPASGDRVGCL